MGGFIMIILDEKKLLEMILKEVKSVRDSKPSYKYWKGFQYGVDKILDLINECSREIDNNDYTSD